MSSATETVEKLQVYYDGQDMVVAGSPEQALASVVSYFGLEDSEGSGPFYALRDDYLILTTIDGEDQPDTKGWPCRRLLGQRTWLLARPASAVAQEVSGVVEDIYNEPDIRAECGHVWEPRVVESQYVVCARCGDRKRDGAA